MAKPTNGGVTMGDIIIKFMEIQEKRNEILIKALEKATEPAKPEEENGYLS